MFSDRRRLLVGGAIAVILGAALWLQLRPAVPAAAGLTPARARSGRPTEAASAEPLRPVRLDALTASREQPAGTQRNPFRFQPKVAPPPPPRPVTPGPGPGPDVQRPSVPAAPPGPPPLPPIPLKFIGVVERANGVKWAVLSDGKAAPIHGKEGDMIEGRYRIVKIGTESIELSYSDGRGRQTVRLTGEK